MIDAPLLPDETNASRKSRVSQKTNYTSSKRRLELFENSFKPTFKRRLNFLVRFFDKHPGLLSSTKMFVGLVFIGIPLIMTIFYLAFAEFTNLRKYYTLPYILSSSIAALLLILLLVFKIRDDIQNNGLLIPSWERHNIGKILVSLGIVIGLLFIFIFFGNRVKTYPQLKEGVTQTKENDCKNFDLGMISINFLFVSIFSDKDKYDKVYCLSITDNSKKMLIKDVHRTILGFLILCLIYSVKIVLFRTKNSIEYGFIMFSVIYYSTVFFSFEIFETSYQKLSSKKKRILEFIPFAIIIICGLILNVKRYIIGIYKRKYSSYLSHKTSLMSFLFALLSFCIIIISLSCLGAGVTMLFYFDINSDLETIQLKRMVVFIWFGCFLYGFGSAFYFGHFVLQLIFKPIIYEYFNAVLKSPFYTKINSNGGRMKKILQLRRRKTGKTKFIN